MARTLEEMEKEAKIARVVGGLDLHLLKQQAKVISRLMATTASRSSLNRMVENRFELEHDPAELLEGVEEFLWDLFAAMNPDIDDT